MKVPVGEARVGSIDDLTSCTSEVHLETHFFLVLLLKLDFYPPGLFWQAEREDGLQKEHTVEMGFSLSFACVVA